MTQPDLKPFALACPFRGTLPRFLFRLLRRPVAAVLHLDEANRRYARIMERTEPEDFLERALNELGVRYEVTPEQLACIPPSGPLIVVSNHPHGALDGLTLTRVVRRVRPDARGWSNFILRCLDPLHESMIFLDPFGRPESARVNMAAIKDSIALLRGGGALVIQPAGMVSHLRLRSGTLSDPPWSDTVVRLVRKTKASVLPVFIEGRNGIGFYLAGRIHKRLRTLLLPHTFLRSRGKVMRIRIGRPIPYAKLDSFSADDDMLNYIRMRTYVLDPHDGRAKPPRALHLPEPLPTPKEIVPAVPTDLLVSDLQSLHEEQRLVVSGEFSVWMSGADQIPNILQEIGRLREVTFRGAGEGTGASIDLDRFDALYEHLFVWNTQKQEIVGAYRIGRTDRILPRYGRDGLYTCTLFDIPMDLLDEISPALELGRSFVRAEYQRQHSPLALLWRGIGQFVARDLQYKYIFGPGSISNAYQSISQQMMLAFLRAHSHLTASRYQVKAKNPPHWPRQDAVETGSRLMQGVQELSALISEIEADGKGVPVLLRQYLQLNAKFLSWHRDPTFGNTLVGLMLADMTTTDPRLLERHLGKEGAARFIEYHRSRTAPAAAQASASPSRMA